MAEIQVRLANNKGALASTCPSSFNCEDHATALFHLVTEEETVVAILHPPGPRTGSSSLENHTRYVGTRHFPISPFVKRRCTSTKTHCPPHPLSQFPLSTALEMSAAGPLLQLLQAVETAEGPLGSVSFTTLPPFGFGSADPPWICLLVNL